MAYGLPEGFELDEEERPQVAQPPEGFVLDKPSYALPEGFTLDDPEEKGATLLGATKALGRGVAEGLTTELPAMAGGALEFVGGQLNRPVKALLGETAGEYSPFRYMEKGGEAVKDWSKEKARQWFGEAPEDQPWLEKVIYEGSKMLAPSVIPGGIASTTARVLKGLGGITRGMKAAQVAGDAAKFTELKTLAQGVAKSANNWGAGSAGVLFGLSQAQSTIDSANQRADVLEKQGDLLGAAEARAAGEGVAPYLTGAIEAVGEFFGTKYLGKLLGVTDIEKRAPKELAKQFLRTLGVEIGTEMGQTAGEAGIEKSMGIRPGADVLQETLDVVGPTAFMTLLTGGLAGTANLAKKKSEYKPHTEITDPKTLVTKIRQDVASGAVSNEKLLTYRKDPAVSELGLTDEINKIIVEQKSSQLDQPGSIQQEGERIAEEAREEQGRKAFMAVTPGEEWEGETPFFTPEEETGFEQKPTGTIEQGEQGISPLEDFIGNLPEKEGPDFTPSPMDRLRGRLTNVPGRTREVQPISEEVIPDVQPEMRQAETEVIEQGAGAMSAPQPGLPYPGIPDVRYEGPASARGQVVMHNFTFMSGPRKGDTFSTKDLEPETVRGAVERKEKKQVHDYSSTQVELPAQTANVFRQYGQGIPDSEVYTDPKDPSLGREENPHITVKYGLHTANPEEVRKVVEDHPPVKAKLGKVSIFESDDYDVVKVDIESPELHALNKKIAGATKVTDTHPTYKPHATIAYVKKGQGKKYVGDRSFEGQEVTFNELTFSGKDGKETVIPLKGAAVQEQPPGQTISPAPTPGAAKGGEVGGEGKREAWEMGLLEYGKTQLPESQRGQITNARQVKAFSGQHIKEIKAAIERGEAVPKEVLQEYNGTEWADRELSKPDLQPKGEGKALPQRTSDTMSEAIALSSPSGRMSKRARKEAEKRLSTALFGEGGLQREKTPQPTEAERLRQHAKRLRDLADSGMNTKKYNKAADEAERQAQELEKPALTMEEKEPENGNLLGGGETSLSTSTSPTGLPLRTVESALRPLVSRIKGVEIVAVKNVEDLPANVLQGQTVSSLSEESRGRIRGVHSVQDGKSTIFLVASNMNSPRDVHLTTLHELVGHEGLRRAMASDKAFQSFLDNLYRSKKNDDLMKWIRENYRFDTSTEYGRRKASDEWFARMATENYGKESLRPWWNRFVRIFRDWVRKLGFKLTLSDREVLDVMRRARQAVEREGKTRLAESATMLSVTKKGEGRKSTAEPQDKAAGGPEEQELQSRLNSVTDEDRLPNVMRAYREQFSRMNPGLVRKFGNVKPNETVTIYRGTPTGEGIRPGDWVAIEERYASQFGYTGEKGQGQVSTKQVRADEVIWNGADANEYFYAPKGEGQIPAGKPQGKAEGGAKTPEGILGPQTRYTYARYATTKLETFERVNPGAKPNTTKNVSVIYNDPGVMGFSVWSDGKILGPVWELPKIGGGVSDSAADLIKRAFHSETPSKFHPPNIADLRDVEQIRRVDFRIPGTSNLGSIEELKLHFGDNTEKVYYVPSMKYPDGYTLEFHEAPFDALKGLGIPPEVMERVSERLKIKALPNPTRPPGDGGQESLSIQEDADARLNTRQKRINGIDPSIRPYDPSNASQQYQDSLFRDPQPGKKSLEDRYYKNTKKVEQNPDSLEAIKDSFRVSSVKTFSERYLKGGKIDHEKFLKETGITITHRDFEDLNKYFRRIQTTTDIAEKHEAARNLLTVQVNRQGRTNQMAIELRKMTEDYFSLPTKSMDKMDLALAYGDRIGKYLKVETLKNKFKLDPDEIKGYFAMRKTMDYILEFIQEQKMGDAFGQERFEASEKNPKPLHAEDIIKAVRTRNNTLSRKQEGKTFVEIKERANEILRGKLLDMGLKPMELDFILQADGLADWTFARRAYMPHSWKTEWRVKVETKDGRKFTLEVPTLTGKIRLTRMGRRKAAEKAALREVSDKLGKENVASVHLIHHTELPVDLYEGTALATAQGVIESATQNIMSEFESGLTEQEKAKLKTIGENIEKSLQELYLAKGWGRHLLARKGIEGYRIDFRNVVDEYLYGFSAYHNKMIAAREFAKAFKEINSNKTPQLWAWAKEYISDMLGESHEAGAFKRIVGLYFIAGDISAITLNMTQNFTHAVGILRGISSKGPIAEFEIFRAMKDVAGAWIEARGMKLPEKSKHLSPIELNAIREAFERGLLDPQFFGEVTGLHTNRWYMSGLDKAQEWMYKGFIGAEAMNRMSTFIAAFRRAERAEMKNSVDVASKAVIDSHFLYGKGNRPELIRKMGAIGNVAYTFATYPLNNIFFLKQRALNILKAATPQERKTAMKVLGSNLAYIFAFGGLNALPFMFLGKLVYGIFTDPEDDWEVLAHKYAPQWAARGVVRGIPSVFGNDLSWKVEGTNIGITPIGIQTAGTIARRVYYQGYKPIERGEAWHTLFMAMPDMLSNPYKAFFSDKQGTGIEGKPPIEYQGSEKALKAMGFSPTRESETRQVQTLAREKRDERVYKLGSFADRYIVALKEKDSGKRSTTIKEINSDVAEYNKKQIAKGREGLPIKEKEIESMIKRRVEARTKGYEERLPQYMRPFQMEMGKTFGLTPAPKRVRLIDR